MGEMSKKEKAELYLYRALSRLVGGEDIRTDEIMEPLEDFIDAKIAEAIRPVETTPSPA